MTISILITNYNTTHFIDFLIQKIYQLTKSPFKIYIHDNGSTKNEMRRLINLIRKYPSGDIILISTIDSNIPSVAHGNALDRLISLVETDFFAIFDSDCVPLMYAWDQKIIKQLQKGIDIIGSPFLVGPNSSKYDDFPAQFFTVARTDVYRMTLTNCQAENTTDRDTCMKWKEDYSQKNKKGKIFQQVSTRDVFIDRLHPTVCVVYYLDGEIIGSHFGRGSSGSKAKYLQTGLFSRIPAIRYTLKTIMAKNEMRSWKKWCSGISANAK